MSEKDKSGGTDFELDFDFDVDFPDAATAPSAPTQEAKPPTDVTDPSDLNPDMHVTEQTPRFTGQPDAATVIPPDAVMEELRVPARRSMIPGPGVGGRSIDQTPTDPTVGGLEDTLKIRTERIERHTNPDLLRNAAAAPADELSEADCVKILGGSLDTTPKVCVSLQEAMDLGLNHRAGFLFSQIDGSMSFEELVSISPMSREDTLRILVRLVEAGAIK